MSAGLASRPVASGQQDANAAKKTGSAEQDFIDQVNKPVGQRMIEAWLKAHNLSEEDLKSMPPEKRTAIMKQMADEIKQQMKNKVEQKTGLVDVMA